MLSTGWKKSNASSRPCRAVNIRSDLARRMRSYIARIGQKLIYGSGATHSGIAT
jgi:hypothetical protein